MTLYCLPANSLLIVGAYKRRKDLVLTWLGIYGFLLVAFSFVLFDEFLNHIENNFLITFFITETFYTAGKNLNF